jgi:hypothetical protein
LPVAVTEAVKPSKSNGWRVRKLTTPPKPPSGRLADKLLYTSMPWASSGGMSSQAKLRPLAALKLSRPFKRLTVEVRPRIVMLVPSPR